MSLLQSTVTLALAQTGQALVMIMSNCAAFSFDFDNGDNYRLLYDDVIMNVSWPTQQDTDVIKSEAVTEQCKVTNRTNDRNNKSY
jgi:hypothetical protein